MPDNTDNSARAFQELVRVLDEAVRAGVNSIGLQYKGRELIVFHQTGPLGVRAASPKTCNGRLSMPRHNCMPSSGICAGPEDPRRLEMPSTGDSGGRQCSDHWQELQVAGSERR
jgi:hypothetical protein